MHRIIALPPFRLNLPHRFAAKRRQVNQAFAAVPFRSDHRLTFGKEKHNKIVISDPGSCPEVNTLPTSYGESMQVA